MLEDSAKGSYKAFAERKRCISGGHVKGECPKDDKCSSVYSSGDLEKDPAGTLTQIYGAPLYFANKNQLQTYIANKEKWIALESEEVRSLPAADYWTKKVTIDRYAVFDEDGKEIHWPSEAFRWPVEELGPEPYGIGVIELFRIVGKFHIYAEGLIKGLSKGREYKNREKLKPSEVLDGVKTRVPFGSIGEEKLTSRTWPTFLERQQGRERRR